MLMKVIENNAMKIIIGNSPVNTKKYLCCNVLNSEKILKYRNRVMTAQPTYKENAIPVIGSTSSVRVFLRYQ